MDSLVISTLLIQSLGIVATVFGLALISCLPRRGQHRNCNWTPADGAATEPTIAASELRHAA